MFGKNRITKALNSRLPEFERPACQVDGCNAVLENPKPIHTEAQGAAGVLTVHCLTRCPACGAQYKGERKIGLGKKTRALEQSFHPYGEEDRAFVQRLLPKYQQNQDKLGKINQMPIDG